MNWRTRLLSSVLIIALSGCTRKVVKHDGPIVFREMSCNVVKKECTCDMPVLVLDAKTGRDEVICNKQPLQR